MSKEAMEAEKQGEVQEKDLQKQLAATVRSIHWSYAIFWCPSSTQQGVLVWGDGYYNGEIKTRKTTQPTEFKADDHDQMGLHRSEQLRELFESLSGDTNQQAKRPSASLSPEDLTPTEWYYLVCMSFSFVPGNGLPGKVLESNQYIWLTDAQFADTKLFSRTLLAKSASITTVVCFPFMGGVLELGTTEHVMEDAELLKQVTTSFWEISLPVLSEQSISNSPVLENEADDDDVHDILDDVVEDIVPIQDTIQELITASPNDSSDAHGSVNWSECISQFFVNPHRMKNLDLDILQDGDYAKSISLDLDGNKTHYQMTLAAVLKNPKELTPVTHSHESSFGIWRDCSGTAMSVKTPQRMLKKMLVESGGQMKAMEENVNSSKVHKAEADDNGVNHVLSERRRREKLNEKFMILKSLIPSISKVDKASILCDTISYIKQLEQRVEELESSADTVSLEARSRRKHPDLSERTSDNYNNNNRETSSRKSKRKASTDMEEADADSNHWFLSKDGAVDINVRMIERDVMIEMECPWRDGLLLEIVDAMSKLHLDAHSVKSSTVDNVLVLTLKTKIRDSVAMSAGAIKRALKRVIVKL